MKQKAPLDVEGLFVWSQRLSETMQGTTYE